MNRIYAFDQINRKSGNTDYDEERIGKRVKIDTLQSGKNGILIYTDTERICVTSPVKWHSMKGYAGFDVISFETENTHYSLKEVVPDDGSRRDV